MIWVFASVTLLFLVGFTVVWINLWKNSSSRSCVKTTAVADGGTCVSDGNSIVCEDNQKPQQRCGGHIECVPTQPDIPADFHTLPQNTVRVLNSTAQDPLYVFLEIENLNENTLKKPDKNWTITSPEESSSSLSDPWYYYPTDVPLTEDQKKRRRDPIAVGSATWQILQVPKGQQCDLNIPPFQQGQAWSVRPLRMCEKNTFCADNETYGSPIIIECGQGMVCDMSAVDGVNFLCHMTFTNTSQTTNQDITVIDFQKNPCPTTNQVGCLTPHKDGFFLPDFTWESSPCPAGTCNLQGQSKKWCDDINFGQCSTSDSTWSKEGQSGGPPSCRLYSNATTYCFSHNDAPSSVTLDYRKKLRLEYRDLTEG